MSDRVLASLAALAVLVLAPVLVTGQAPSAAGATKTTAATKTWTPPRTPDGQPDLQGIWSNSTFTPLERPAEFAGKAFFTEQEAIEFFNNAAKYQSERDPDVHYARTEYGLDKWQNGVKPNLRTSLIVDPPDGRIPSLTPEARKRIAANPRRRSSDVRSRGLYERCITGYWGGLPMLKGGEGGGSEVVADVGTGADAEHQILQTAGYIVIQAQSNNDVRIIPLDARPHLSPSITRWFGDSRGHWEGNTLVVETTNFSEQALFRGSTKALHLVERFTRVDADTLRYQFTVDDPTTWTRPWTVEVPWPKVKGPVYEFACHEDNYGLLAVLKGEIAAEDAAKRGSTK